MKGTRTYSIYPPIDDDAERTYIGPVKFLPEGKNQADPFLLTPGSWQKLGRPKRIRVTVEALELWNPVPIPPPRNPGKKRRP